MSDRLITVIGSGHAARSLALALHKGRSAFPIAYINPDSDAENRQSTSGFAYDGGKRLFDRVLPKTAFCFVAEKHIEPLVQTGQLLNRLAPETLLLPFGTGKACYAAAQVIKIPSDIYLIGLFLPLLENESIGQADLSVLYLGRPFVFCPHPFTPTSVTVELERLIHSIGAVPVIPEGGAQGNPTAELRKLVDQFDQRILEALQARLQVVRSIGRFKVEAASPIRDDARETQMVEDRLRWAKARGLPEELIRDLFERILEASREIQSTLEKKKDEGPS